MAVTPRVVIICAGIVDPGMTRIRGQAGAGSPWQERP